MFSLIFSNPVKPFNSVIIHQIRLFSREPFPNKVQHYLYRANLIDSIRLSLRSTTTSDPTLPSLLDHRLLDSFVVKNALRSSPSVASAWSIFKTLRRKKPHFSFETETLHAFATVLAKFQRSSELNSLIGVVNTGKFGQVHFSFMNLMNLYATAGDFDSVLKTWDEFRCSGEEKKGCTESYNIVMQVYMTLGKDSEAVQTFDQIINDGGIPNSRTFTIMIEHLVKLGNLDAAMKVFETLPLMRITRTLKHYSVLVEAFVDAQRFGKVKTLLAEMKADGKFPSRRMLEPLKLMREAGFEQETEEFLREMFPDERIKDISMYSMDNPSDSEEEGDEHNDNVNEGQVKLKPWLDPKALATSLKKWSSDAVTALEEANFVWTNLLVCKMLRNFRSPETAWSFFCWVAIQPGFTHDAYTIERMMAMLARNGQVELVDKLISKVRIEGIKLPFSTIRLIIDLYGISKKPDAAIKVFRQDRTLCGSISDFNLMLLYSSLLRTLTKCKRNAEALETLEDMILTGVSPDIQTFSGLMYHFALQGEIQTVERLFSMVRHIGLEPDPYMLKLLVQAYCRCERSVLAYRVFQDMKDSNLMPDRETKELLVKSLWREEKRKEAAAVEESYEEENNNKNSSNVLRLALKGHVWTISSTDISRVYNLYRDCVLKTST
ncbi:Pentatricopeptide repeat [Arabidopsis thaliana x Arabidopsis arenosa]|uniref:Pentatricopeptide repeat n=1 Tax=Arabidopsis thaliana x Arabidopsis arenosa TaxID=1240361 RepID=A0A8T1XVF6_9BRAS|nr:Pentatricopeptide repeat [Arabidopsis thaliana x Arabidopsis arenosa]